MKTLSIIGAGKLGKTLGRLFQQSNTFIIKDIFCTTLESAKNSVKFIQAGKPVNSLDLLSNSDIFLISTPDNQIENITDKILSKFPNSFYFHTSGSLSSKVLKTKLSCSIHPVHSFANPENSVKSFKGTMCGVEGNEKVLDLLIPAFKQIGGKIFNINPDKKSLYHSATVIACNYFVVIEDIAFELLQASGIDNKDIKKILSPILQGTLNNIIDKGSEKALTGPISRGDYQTVKNHIKELGKYDQNIINLYKALGKQALKIAEKQELYDKKNLNKIDKLLK